MNDSNDPRYANGLDEAAKNPDGTYNAFKAMAWMSEALHPGHGVSEAEIKRTWDDLLKRKGKPNNNG